MYIERYIHICVFLNPGLLEVLGTSEAQGTITDFEAFDLQLELKASASGSSEPGSKLLLRG